MRIRRGRNLRLEPDDPFDIYLGGGALEGDRHQSSLWEYPNPTPALLVRIC